jgi:hypothetical protein
MVAHGNLRVNSFAQVLSGVAAILTTPRGESLAARIGIATDLVVVGDLVGEGAAQEELGRVITTSWKFEKRLRSIALIQFHFSAQHARTLSISEHA